MNGDNRVLATVLARISARALILLNILDPRRLFETRRLLLSVDMATSNTVYYTSMTIPPQYVSYV